MTALPPDAFVPVPLRWRHVAPGEVVLDPQGRPWMLTNRSIRGEITVTLGAHSRTASPDPDEYVQVLVPVTEAEAVELLRDELGARLAGQREHNASTT